MAATTKNGNVDSIKSVSFPESIEIRTTPPTSVKTWRNNSASVIESTS